MTLRARLAAALTGVENPTLEQLVSEERNACKIRNVVCVFLLPLAGFAMVQSEADPVGLAWLAVLIVSVSVVGLCDVTVWGLRREISKHVGRIFDQSGDFGGG